MSTITTPPTTSAAVEAPLNPIKERNKWLERANELPESSREAYKAEIRKVFCVASQVLQALPGKAQGIQALASSNATSVQQMHLVAKEMFNRHKSYTDGQVAVLQRLGTQSAAAQMMTLPPSTVPVAPSRRPGADFLSRALNSIDMSTARVSAFGIEVVEKSIGAALQPMITNFKYGVEGLQPVALKLCEASETVRNVAQSTDNVIKKTASFVDKFTKARVAISDATAHLHSTHYDTPLPTSKQYVDDVNHISKALTTDAMFRLGGMALKVTKKFAKAAGATLKSSKPVAATTKLLPPKIPRQAEFKAEEQLMWGKNWKHFDPLVVSEQQAWTSAGFGTASLHPPVVRYLKKGNDKVVALVTETNSLDITSRGKFVIQSVPRESSALLYNQMLGYRFIDSLGLQHLDAPLVRALGTYGEHAFLARNYMPGESLGGVARFIGKQPIYSVAREYALQEYTQGTQQFGNVLIEIHSYKQLGSHPSKVDVEGYLSFFENMRTAATASLAEVSPLFFKDSNLRRIVTKFTDNPGTFSYGLNLGDFEHIVWNGATKRLAIVDARTISSNLISSQMELAAATNNLMLNGIRSGMTYAEIRQAQQALITTYHRWSPLCEPAAERFFDYTYRVQTIGTLAKDIAAGASIDRSILERLVWDLNQSTGFSFRSAPGTFLNKK